MKKTVNSEITYLYALIGDSFACALLTWSAFGVSCLSSLPYVLSFVFEKISYGMFSFLVQVVLLILLIAITKQPKITYIMSFIVGFIYGALLDVFLNIFNALLPYTLFMRILMFLIGFIMLCYIQALYFVTELPLMPYDAFVADICRYKKYRIDVVKTIYDMSFLISASLLCVAVLKKFIGIGIGTVIIGVFTGMLQQKFIDYLNSANTYKCFTKTGEKLKEMSKVN